MGSGLGSLDANAPEALGLRTVRVQGSGGGEDDVYALGCDDLDLAGVPRGDARAGDAARPALLVGLDYLVDLGQDAGEADTHRGAVSWSGCLRRRHQEDILEDPTAQVHQLAGNAEQSEEAQRLASKIGRASCRERV